MADTTDAKEQTPAGPAIAAVAGASDGMIGGAGCSARARADARPDSDYAVAVFLKDFRAFADELTALVDIETDLLRDTGAVINALPLGAGTHRDRTGFMAEVRRDALDL